MYLYPYFVACLKQCIVGVPETCRLILKVYLFVFALFLNKLNSAEMKRLKWFGHCLRRERNQPHLCEIAKTRGFWEKEQRDKIQGDLKKYQLTEDMAQYRKYWMTIILAGPAQGDCQER